MPSSSNYAPPELAPLAPPRGPVSGLGRPGATGAPPELAPFAAKAAVSGSGRPGATGAPPELAPFAAKAAVSGSGRPAPTDGVIPAERMSAWERWELGSL